MTAREYVEGFVRISNLKYPVDPASMNLYIDDFIITAMLLCIGRAKNKKWYEMSLCSNAVIHQKEDIPTVIEHKIVLLKESLISIMESYTGLKGYRGRFRFTEFREFKFKDGCASIPDGERGRRWKK